MSNTYETPELTLVGQADDIIMGVGPGGDDFPFHSGFDFEFEQD